MKISFDFLSEPVSLGTDRVNVLCIENRPCLRKTVAALLEGTEEENGMVLSENYNPCKFKSSAEVIFNYYALSLPTPFMKKIYENVCAFCVSEMQERTNALARLSFDFLEEINSNFDFDFSCGTEFNLIDFLKSQGFKPSLKGKSLLENILDYILLVQKYSPVKCFVLINLNLYFTKDELDSFYSDIVARKINLLVIEGTADFIRTGKEKITIIDEDLCEIVEK